LTSENPIREEAWEAQFEISHFDEEAKESSHNTNQRISVKDEFQMATQSMNKMNQFFDVMNTEKEERLKRLRGSSQQERSVMKKLDGFLEQHLEDVVTEVLNQSKIEYEQWGAILLKFLK